MICSVNIQHKKRRGEAVHSLSKDKKGREEAAAHEIQLDPHKIFWHVEFTRASFFMLQEMMYREI